MQALDSIKNIYLFRGATDAELAALAAIAEPKAYIVGEYIYNSGDLPDALLIIESGTIDVVLKDKDVVLASVGAGQALGELAYFEREGRLASALTREPTHVIRLPFDKLDKVMESHPNLAMAFYRHACTFFARQLRSLAPDLNRRYF